MTESIQPFPIRKDIQIPRLGDWHRTIILLQDDKVTPIDTTGYTMTMTIRSSLNGEVYDTLTIANGKIVHTPASGQFNLNLTAAEIAAYDFVRAVYDIAYVDGSANTTHLLTGSVEVV
jgi:hypothetical protein